MSNQQPPNHNRIFRHAVVLFVLAMICELLANVPATDGLPRWGYLAVAIVALLYCAYEFYFFFFVLPKTTDSEDED